MNANGKARMQEGKRGPIVVGVQWSQSGHDMQRHRVTDDEHAGHQGPTNAVGGQKRKSAEPLSEGYAKSACP